jgi:hypothetical protein
MYLGELLPLLCPVKQKMPCILRSLGQSFCFMAKPLCPDPTLSLYLTWPRVYMGRGIYRHGIPDALVRGFR